MNPTGFDKGPNRRTGRYDSEAEILKKIDQAHTEAKDLKRQAEVFDRKADEAIKAQAGLEHVPGWRQEANTLREQANRKIEVRCKFLSNKLSVLRTELLPGVLTDRSIPKVGADRFLERTKPAKKRQ